MAFVRTLPGADRCWNALAAALLLGVAVLIVVVWFIGKAKTCLDQYPDRGPASNQCVQNTITGGN